MDTVRRGHVNRNRVDDDALACGLYVVDCGSSDRAAGEPGMAGDSSFCSWKSGQVLSEFLIIYVTRGSGTYESRTGGCRPVKAGDILILSPGEWHRYYHEDDAGWEECWVGFSGEYAQHLMAHFFQSPERIIHVGFDLGLNQSIRSLPAQLNGPQPGQQLLAATRTIDIIAQIRALALRKSNTMILEDWLREICMQLTADLGQPVDFKTLAAQAGVSYTKFRASFKDYTGLPPHQFVIEKRINRAMELLRHTGKTVSEIADLLGFETLYYFSRLFKHKTGYSPTAFRQQVT